MKEKLNKQERIKLRDKKQNEFIEDYFKHIEKYPSITFKMGTGIGKTWIALKIAAKLQAESPDIKIALAVPTTNLIDKKGNQSWWKEIEEFNKVNENKVDATKIEAHTIAKWQMQDNEGEIPHYDLFIVDEVHNSLSKVRSKMYKKYTWDKLIGLSATIPTEKEKKLEKIAPIRYRYSIDNAIDDGLLPEYIVYKVGITLSRTANIKRTNKKGEVKLWSEYSWHKFLNESMEKNRKILYANNLSPLEVISGRINYKRLPKHVSQAAFFYRWAQQERIKLYRNSSSKLSKAKNILATLDRAFVFCGSIEQAQDVTEGDTDLQYHSKRNAKENTETLNNFNEGIINTIATSKKLNEGANLKNVEKAVILYCNSSAGQLIQRIGRSMRGDEPEIFVIYVKDSADANNALSALNGIAEKRIKNYTNE